ncbi:MAG TPA: radical SAM protein [Elusimicrobiota bacterium]|nr:radical SAM protein [Elusimicrobiota bacterium]
MRTACHPVSDRLASLCETHLIPHTALLELTWRCALNCLHCYIPAGHRRKSLRQASELTSAQWCDALDQLADLGTLYLILSGGEIGLRQDLTDIVRHARERDFDVTLYTSGTSMDDRTIDALGRLEVARVEISVYGRPKPHDAITGNAGSFQKSFRTAKRFAAAGVQVVLKCTLMERTFGEYPSLIELAKEHGFSYQLDPILVPRDDGDPTPLDYRLDDDGMSAVFKDVSARVSTEIRSLEELSGASPECAAGKTFLSIGPDGTVYPCIEWRTELGNISERPLRDIWFHSEEAGRIHSLRARDYVVCRSCELLAWCPRCTGMAFREGDVLGKAAESCRLAALNRRFHRLVTPHAKHAVLC